MKHKSFTITIIILCAVTLFAGLFMVNGFAGLEPDEKKLVILFTHDMHSQFLPRLVRSKAGAGEEIGGYARMYSLIKKERAKNGGAILLVDAGDFAMSTLFQTNFMKEASEIRLMGRMGYDAITFGNHDFDFRAQGLAKMLASAKKKGKRLPPIVSSNIVFSQDQQKTSSLEKAFKEYPVKQYSIIKKNGLRIGIFGLMGKDAAEDAPFARPAVFTDYIEAGRRMADILKNREKVDMIVCLSHTGTSPVKSHSEDEILAKKVPEIDVIISGHTHTVLPKPIVSGKTIIVSSGCYSSYLGILEVSFSGQNRARVEKYEIRKITPDIPEDKKISREISRYRRLVDTNYLQKFGYRFSQSVAESGFDMESLTYAYEHPGEMGIGNLVTDAYREAVRKAEGKNYDYVHVVIHALGHIRDSFLKGKITTAEVFRVLPLYLGMDGLPGYPLASFRLTGREIKRILEIETTVAQLKDDAHLQVSGVSFTYNPNRVPFDRVMSVMMREKNGKLIPVQEGKLYRICLNFYSANMMKDLPKLSYGLIRAVPKDKNGAPIYDMKTAIIDANGSVPGTQEIKEWLALASYLKSFPSANGNGIPDIPERYSRLEGRIKAIPSWNPVSLVAGANYITYSALGIILVLFGGIGFIIVKVVRKVGD